MEKRFASIGLIGRRQDPRVRDSVLALCAHLRSRGVDVTMDAIMAADFDPPGVSALPAGELAVRSDLIIAVGGDGTMLYAARVAAPAGVPLLGVNRGRLGFLADVGPDEMLQRVDEVLAGDFVHESRLMVAASIARAEGATDNGIALNDIVLQKWDIGRMLEFETWIDGRYVNTHGGDGLIVATPTGSTAYALSGGGPILESSLDALVLVPVCPHTLSDRPVVVASRSEIEIRVLERDETRAQVVGDGQLIGDMGAGDKLIVRLAPERVTLLHPLGYDYYKILRSKLAWGRGSSGWPPHGGG